MDTTRDRRDPEQMYFLKMRHLNDVAGLVLNMASRHNVSPESIRLFVAPDKKTWTKMSLDFASRVDWSL